MILFVLIVTKWLMMMVVTWFVMWRFITIWLDEIFTDFLTNDDITQLGATNIF